MIKRKQPVGRILIIDPAVIFHYKVRDSPYFPVLVGVNDHFVEFYRLDERIRYGSIIPEYIVFEFDWEAAISEKALADRIVGDELGGIIILGL